MNADNPNLSSSTTSPASPSPEKTSRREFLEWFSVLLGGAATAVLAVPAFGFVVGPLFGRTPQAWRTVGQVDSFKIGETVAVRFEDASTQPWAGVTAHTAAWLRRESKDQFIAFSINCSHLGCPVRWLPKANLFMCPCHGGVYYQDGSVAAGPPPRPLTRYNVRVRGTDVQLETRPIPIT